MNVLKIIIAMTIWGSIGLFVRTSGLSPFEVAFFRAFIASICLIFIDKVFYKNKEVVNKKEVMLLLLCGVLMGLNWVLLFTAYQYTTISIASICYDFAPIFVVMLASIFLKEKITPKTIVCIGFSLVGLFMIASNTGTSTGNSQHIKGILFAMSGAILYSLVVVISLTIKNVSSIKISTYQMVASSIVLLPFVIQSNIFFNLKLNAIPIILILGIVHTCLAYILYFSGMKKTKANTVAILGYIEPITAVVLSFIVLHEPLTTMQIIGGVIVLGSTYVIIKK